MSDRRFAAQFQGHVNADGIALSVNGTDWYPIFNAPDTPSGQWQRFHVDLTVATASTGVSLEGPVFVKFQQYDNSPLEDDGRGWDDIVVHRADDADWLSLQLKRRESVSLLGSVDGSGDLKIELFDDEGTRLVEGVSPPSPLKNGSFETGDFSHWTVEVDGYTDWPWQILGPDRGGGLFLDSTDPQDGQFVAFNGFDGDGPLEYRMFQDLAIPANVPQALLSWGYRAQWTFFDVEAQSRELIVELLDPKTDELLAELFHFSTGPAGSQSLWGDTGWESVSVDLKELGFAGRDVRLVFREEIPDSFTGDGQLELDAIQLDLGLSWPSNVDDLIRDFVAPSSGQYFVRVSGTPLTPYTVVATRNVEFDLENNDDITSAQSLLVPDVQGRQWLMGAVEADREHGGDFYQLFLDGGQPLSVQTFTPASGDGQFINKLDPLIHLYDASGHLVVSDDNSASDGRNAELRYRVPRGAEGVYFLEITASLSSAARPVGGEYIVSVRGATIPEFTLNDVAAAMAVQPDDEANRDDSAPPARLDDLPPAGEDPVEPLSPAAVDWLHGYDRRSCRSGPDRGRPGRADLGRRRGSLRYCPADGKLADVTVFQEPIPGVLHGLFDGAGLITELVACPLAAIVFRESGQSERTRVHVGFVTGEVGDQISHVASDPQDDRTGTEPRTAATRDAGEKSPGLQIRHCLSGENITATALPTLKGCQNPRCYVAHVAHTHMSPGGEKPPAARDFQQHPTGRRLPVPGAKHEGGVHDHGIQSRGLLFQNRLLRGTFRDHVVTGNRLRKRRVFIRRFLQ